MRALRMLSLLAVGLVPAMAAAQSQHPCPGFVTANALAPVARTAPIGLAGRAQTETERRIHAAVTTALERTGHRVNDGAALVLSWRGGVSRDGLPGGGGVADMFSGSAFHDSDDLHWMQDVSRLRERPRPGPLRLSAFVELRERQSRRVVWMAVISCERHGTDEAALFATLANAVAPLIGRSASAQPF